MPALLTAAELVGLRRWAEIFAAEKPDAALVLRLLDEHAEFRGAAAKWARHEMTEAIVRAGCPPEGWVSPRVEPAPLGRVRAPAPWPGSPPDAGGSRP